MDDDILVRRDETVCIIIDINKHLIVLSFYTNSVYLIVDPYEIYKSFPSAGLIIGASV